VGTSEGLFSFDEKLRIIVAMTFWSLAGMWLIWCLRGGQNSAQYREATREPQSVTKKEQQKPETKPWIGMDVIESTGRGYVLLKVVSVVAHGPAYTAGFREGDYLDICSSELLQPADGPRKPMHVAFRDAVRLLPVGHHLRVTRLRYAWNGSLDQRHCTLVVGEKPPSTHADLIFQKHEHLTDDRSETVKTSYDAWGAPVHPDMPQPTKTVSFADKWPELRVRGGFVFVSDIARAGRTTVERAVEQLRVKIDEENKVAGRIEFVIETVLDDVILKRVRF
jgi:hypothetical protein